MKTDTFKPILYSTPMVQAVQANRKKQTRRTQGLEIPNQSPSGYEFLGWDKNVAVFKSSEGKFRDCKPKFNAGDILWVRETFAKPPITAFGVPYIHKAGFDRTMCGWKPSIFMPKEAARFFLKVTNVRVERLQDISEEDAIAEGIEPGEIGFKSYNSKNIFEVDALWSFQNLWQSINAKKHPWKSNPWVWVYEFKRIEKPENFLP